MLRITVELWPGGDHTRAETVASMDLWNDLSGTTRLGNYEASAILEASPWNKQGEKRGGKVTGHDRSLPVWSLVVKMLHSMGYGSAVVHNRGRGWKGQL